jgi:hypothetical protein
MPAFVPAFFFAKRRLDKAEARPAAEGCGSTPLHIMPRPVLNNAGTTAGMAGRRPAPRRHARRH